MFQTMGIWINTKLYRVKYKKDFFEDCRIITYDDIVKSFGENIIIDVTSIKNNKKVRLV